MTPVRLFPCAFLVKIRKRHFHQDMQSKTLGLTWRELKDPTHTLLRPLLSLKKSKHSFEDVSRVCSNLAGPTESISLQTSLARDSKAHSAIKGLFQTNKMRIVVPRLVSIFNVFSYDSFMFINTTLYASCNSAFGLRGPHLSRR